MLQLSRSTSVYIPTTKEGKEVMQKKSSQTIEENLSRMNIDDDTFYMVSPARGYPCKKTKSV